MKVLFVCHRVPFPPKRGGKIRPFNIIRHLSRRGHRVTVASLARSEQERQDAEGLAGSCDKALVEVIPKAAAIARMVARLPSEKPSSFGYFYSPALARRIRNEIATSSYDLIFVHCSSVAPYVAEAQGPLKILDYGDMDSQKWREYSSYRKFPLSMGYWLEGVKLERVEFDLARKFDLCTCTTRAELDSLRTLQVMTPSDWFPNGVDSDYFQPSSAYQRDLIVFVGRMDYYPNQKAVLDFCHDVLPQLRRRCPEVRFEIVGADPPSRIKALGMLPGVSVTGSVPDVRPYVARAALSVAPLSIARGTQNKILESMAMGVPVVCSFAASRGVDAEAGEHLLTATQPGEYVDAIHGILASPELRMRLAHAGRERILTNHSWSAAMGRLDAIISGAFERRDNSGCMPSAHHPADLWEGRVCAESMAASAQK